MLVASDSGGDEPTGPALSTGNSVARPASLTLRWTQVPARPVILRADYIRRVCSAFLLGVMRIGVCRGENKRVLGSYK